MLELRLILHDANNPGLKKTIGRGVITNVTEDGKYGVRPMPFGDYEFELILNRKQWKTGTLERFPRSKENLWKLIHAMLIECFAPMPEGNQRS